MSRAATATSYDVSVWSPEVKVTVPIVRRAILVKHQPRLEKSETERAFEVLESVWAEWRHEYLEQIARLVGVPASQLEIVVEKGDDQREGVRKRQDGKTPMIDLPRVRTKPGSVFALDLRHCLALCIDDLSSKVWTRVGLPQTDQRAGSCPPRQLRSVVSRLREIATACDEWFLTEFRRLVDGSFDRHAVRSGTLEVTTVGLRFESTDDGELDDRLEEWLFQACEPSQPDSVVELRPNLDNRELLDYVAAAADLETGEELSTLHLRDREAYWLSMSTAVKLRNQELVPRTTLYLVRPRRQDDVAQVVGVGLDDSAHGELAREAALKVSRLLANQI